jgi:tetratricopeptide (TPR) repeat protein
MASRIGDEVTEGQARLSLGIVLIHQGLIDEGLSLVEEGFRVAVESDNLELSLRAHNAIASIMMDFAPDYERGWSILWEGIELSQRSGRRDFEGWLWHNVGNYAYDQGKIPEIERAARMSREIGERLSYAHLVMGAEYYDALVAFLRSDFDEAERYVHELLAGGHAHFEVQIMPYLFILLGESALVRGRLDEAIRWFRQGMDRLAGDFMLGMADELLFYLIRALVLAGQSDEATEPLQHLRRVAKGRPNSEAFLAWAEGLVTDDPAEGAKRLRSAIETFRRLTRPIDEARCLMDLAGLLRASGGDGRAEDDRAGELLTACGAEVFLKSPSPSPAPGPSGS